MKHVKLFEQFLSELNETVYQLGFDGSGMYWTEIPKFSEIRGTE